MRDGAEQKPQKWTTPPIKAAWFEDDEQAENELKAAQPSTSTSTPSPSKEKEAQRGEVG